MTAFIGGNTEGIIPGLYGMSSGNEPVTGQGEMAGDLQGSGAASGTAQVQTQMQSQTPVTAVTASGSASSAGGTYEQNSAGGSDDMAGVLKAAIIVFGVVALVLPTEFFIYKLVKLKKEDRHDKENTE
jgi:hypothetical protein